MYYILFVTTTTTDIIDTRGDKLITSPPIHGESLIEWYVYEMGVRPTHAIGDR